MTPYLFVYGTLRKCFSNPSAEFIQLQADYVSDACIQGCLYEVDSYPGLVISDAQEETVKGEVYYLRDPSGVLARLDDYEECSDRYAPPHEYVRQKCSVLCVDESLLVAWVYLYARDVSCLEHIVCGDYAEFLSLKNSA